IQNISVHMWIAFDGFSDLVYLLDIAIQFRTGYLEQGLMVCDASKLAGHYLRSRSFLMDIVALTPLDLLQLRFGFAPLLRFPRFIKVYRCYRFYYMVESRTIYPNLWRVANLIHILLLLSHWFGCFHYILSEFEDFRGAWAYTNPHKANNSEWRAITRKYVASVYWSTLTLTTIGGDHVTPSSNLQYAFTILSYLIGVFIFATIVGQVGNVITNRNASRLEFERLLDGAKLYMRHHKVPHQMQRRVQRWYDYSWSRGRMRGGGDINSALGSLPDKLKTELALHVNLKTLKKVTIFQECQPEFLHDLVLKMRAYIFTPGDLICRKGEVAREMFIIADGILEVISETGKVLTQMKAGDFFGEIGILNLDGFNRRTADVRSVGYSELFSLSREDVLSAMKDYPEAQEILQAMGRKRLMEARLAAANCVNTSQTNTTSNTTFKQQELNRQFQGNAGTLSGLGTVDSVAPTGAGSSQGSTQSVRSLSTHGPRSMDTIRKLRKDLKYLFRSRTLAPNASSCCTAENASIRPGFGNTYQHSSGPHSQQQPQQLQYHSHGSSAVASSGPTGMNKSITRLLRRFHVENFRQTSTGGINSINPPTAPCKGQTTEEFRYGDEGVAEGGPLSPPIASGRGVPQPSQQPLGAGLSLLERIKLLKEVERQRKSSTASSLSLTQSMGSGAVGNIAPISSVPSASTAGSALASSVSVSATAPLTSISIATAMTTSSSATAAVAAVPVGHNHQQQQQQQMTTTRIPVHSLRHCHPATGRSPRSELLLLPQQPTTGSRATLSVGTGQLEARRYSATPPSSLPLLHSHVPKFQSHTHGHHLHGQQQLYALADVPLTPDQSSVHSRPQRIVENLRRATMVSATFEASSPPPLNDAASGTEVPLLRRVLMLKRRASDENSRAASRPESLQLTEVPPAQLNVCSVGSGSRGRMSLAKVSPRTETTVNEWLASSSAKSSSADVSKRS
ncbi:potassium/sodium hyperpolarization-activated cyclic nucleotide-gated channel 1-like, partial [Varroa jacobsoni]|uniref:potassium/sodium hyperpolarization-activated cyclic nucleotide-gated channel 1-like n=1 Tax=Varroa jacobsoni TaxID=62625 RepID=UPI000BF717A4